MTRAVLFDLDETLLDRAASLANYVKSHYRRQNLRRHVAFEVYRDRFIELDNRGYADRRELFGTLAREFPGPLSAEESLADFRQNAWKNCTTFGGAAQILRRLRRRGYKLGIITNGSTESQSVKLSESGLNLLVDAALISEQEQIKKPRPEIFFRAAARLGAPAADCVFVGDDPRTDVGGARQAGMKTVWLKGPHPWPAELTFAPDYKISSLRELPGTGLF